MSLSIIHIWKCDLCDNQHQETQHDLHHGYHVVTHTSLPPSWSFISGDMICPLHTIEVTDKEIA